MLIAAIMVVGGLLVSGALAWLMMIGVWKYDFVSRFMLPLAILAWFTQLIIFTGIAVLIVGLVKEIL